MGLKECHLASLKRAALLEAEANLYRELRSSSINIDSFREELSQAETAWLLHSYTCAACLSSKIREFFGGVDTRTYGTEFQEGEDAKPRLTNAVSP